MNTQRENIGSAVATIGGYTIMADFLDLENYWLIGVIALVIGAVVFLWPEEKR